MKKVLIIEDSFDIGSALKQLIEFEGYEAIWAHAAFEGRERAFADLPDLIIVDVRLPDEDGLNLARVFRNDPKTSRIPILCVSSYINGLRQEAVEAGCSDVFSKTTFVESYQEILRRYLGEPDELKEAEQAATADGQI